MSAKCVSKRESREREENSKIIACEYTLTTTTTTNKNETISVASLHLLLDLDHLLHLLQFLIEPPLLVSPDLDELVAVSFGVDTVTDETVLLLANQ